jgi:hypothetical protein
MLHSHFTQPERNFERCPLRLSKPNLLYSIEQNSTLLYQPVYCAQCKLSAKQSYTPISKTCISSSIMLRSGKDPGQEPTSTKDRCRSNTLTLIRNSRRSRRDFDQERISIKKRYRMHITDQTLPQSLKSRRRTRQGGNAAWKEVGASD